MTTPVIDTTFDMRTDAGGKDPDIASPTLRRYHRMLWSKPLPTGQLFDLDDEQRGVYLHHRSELGEFGLASDSVRPTFTGWLALRPIITQFPEAENEAFRALGYTIGGMMLFPGERIDGKMTLNGARGFYRKIADRFDLTLECIRRHYSGLPSPLAEPLRRYAEFFALFEDFAGYVEFWLLQDLVDADGSVHFFMPFDDFNPPAVPKDVATYRAYRDETIAFTHGRNARIEQWAAANLR